MLQFFTQSVLFTRRLLLNLSITVVLLALLFVAGMALYHTLILLISKASTIAAIAVPGGIYISAIQVYTSLNPVHSLLALIVVFFLTAMFMLVIGAEFLAYTFLIVYVGAIAILFLFVIILLDIKDLTATQFSSLKPVASFGAVTTYFGACFVVFTLLDYFVEFVDRVQFVQIATEPSSTSVLVNYITQEFRDILVFSNLLYSYYSIIFVLIALLLLTAMLGAIVLATSTAEERQRSNFSLIERVISSGGPKLNQPVNIAILFVKNPSINFFILLKRLICLAPNA